MIEQRKSLEVPVKEEHEKSADLISDVVVSDTELLADTSQLDPVEFENLSTSFPETVAQSVKDTLAVTETVEALVAEKDVLLRDVERALVYFSQKEGNQDDNLDVDVEKANFCGDWHELTRQRLEHPIGFLKYVLLKLRHLEDLKPGSKTSILQKESEFRQYIFDQLKKYDEVVSHVFSATELGIASDAGKNPHQLGVAKYGNRPTLFLDAQHKNGSALNDFQRGIIEAHEAGHGVREFVGTEKKALSQLLDLSKVDAAKAGYLANPEEIAERMSQLKNYFGMGPEDRFGKKHLAYAREHYLNDIKLDNTMSDFFAGITPDREAEFIRLINELPI